MTYNELVRHCEACRHFAKANGIKLDSPETMLAIMLQQHEIAELLNDEKMVEALPFIGNADLGKKFKFMDVTVLPVTAKIHDFRYTLRVDSNHLVLKDIGLASQPGVRGIRALLGELIGKKN